VPLQGDVSCSAICCAAVGLARDPSCRYDSVLGIHHMADQVARIRIELRRTKPRIWRRVEVPLSHTLISLHKVIQIAFEWHGGHLFEFEIAGRNFSDPTFNEYTSPDPFGWDPEDAGKIQLREIVDSGISRFDYTYDFGDDWRHLITILRVLDAKPDTSYPAFIAGARCPPFEDIGGVWGFYEFVEAAANPNHAGREQYVEWPGEYVMENFDPEEFDEESIRVGFAALARRIG